MDAKNIISRLWNGEQLTQVGVNVSVNIDRETLINLCIVLLIVAIISILLIKLF